jgi:hypothetical protein
VNIQHSSRSVSWGTPSLILDRVRATLGPIDFDPASSSEFNERVKAAVFLTAEQDGLVAEWPTGNVYCNPPGSKRGGKSTTQLFWSRLMAHRESGKLTHAIFMAFSVEALQSTQGKGVPSIGEFTYCIPAKRISFVSPGGLPGLAPAHSSCIVYVPGTVDITSLFRQSFCSLGCVR